MLEPYTKVKISTCEVGYIVEVSEKYQTYMVEFPNFDIRDITPDDIIEIIDSSKITNRE